ncbi:MAG: ATP-binding protein, partial [Candidatus Promineifilaceae bacterium]
MMNTAVSQATVAPFKDGLEQILTGLAYIDLRIRWAVVRARAHGLNPEDEIRGLYVSDAQVDALLGYELGHSLWPVMNGRTVDTEDWPAVLAQAAEKWRLQMAAVSDAHFPLSRLVRHFNLSSEELEIILIALAPEVDPRYERLFAFLQDDVTRKRPGIDLVLNLLTDSFQEKIALRRFLADDGRLVRSGLLGRHSDSPGREPTLLGQFIRLAPSVVEQLLGHPALDDGLAACAALHFPETPPTFPWLPPDLTDHLLEILPDDLAQAPLLSLQGPYGSGKAAVAHQLAFEIERPLISLNLSAAKTADLDISQAIKATLRDGRLMEAVLFITGWEEILTDNRPPNRLFEPLLAYPGLVLIGGENEWQPVGFDRKRPVLFVSLAAPGFEGRHHAWQTALDQEMPELASLAGQFQFTPGQIAEAAATARDLAYGRQSSLNEADLFAASRAHSNQKLSALATKIAPRYRWRDIVLPDDTLQQLREMVNTAEKRPTVYENWGFGRKMALGKGVSALFAGESGTGKTMAADIMAGELGLDLYKIDLSMLVSKYIGETEKNLSRIFHEATTSNAILFFDEADAIFGKRSEVKDSHDRYANIEISYLLQRMEAYDGVVILATNLRGNLDEAFTRRLSFLVEFPFPEAADRERIWQVTVPKETPLAD